MSVSEEEKIEREIRSKVKGEDIVRAWMGEDIVLESEGTGLREYIKYLVEKVEDVVPGLQIPSEHAHEAFETLMDILNETITRSCKRIGEASAKEEREEVQLYECIQPHVGRFYVVMHKADYSPNYTMNETKITKDRKEAYSDFKSIVESLP